MDNFNYTVPIVKAGRDSQGRWMVHGVACDETVDLQNEVTPPSGLAASLAYMRRYGKFNDDHKDVDVGEITRAEVVTKGELVRRGVLDASLVPSAELAEDALYVAGPLYQHVDRARYYRDVLRSGGRLGLSIQGKRTAQQIIGKSAGGQTVRVNPACFVNKVAITDQPVNPATWVSLQKSLRAVDRRGSRRLMRSICKALETGAGIVAEGDTGGSTLRKQRLDIRRKRKKEGVMETTRKSLLEVESLDNPVAIVKAWDALNDPAHIGDATEDEVRQAKTAVRNAVGQCGLSKSLKSDVCKGLSEGQISALYELESISDADFTAMVDADVAALRKSRGEDDQGGDGEDVELEDMSAKQLVAFAKDNGIDLSDLDEEDLEDADTIRDFIEDAASAKADAEKSLAGDGEELDKPVAGEEEVRKSLEESLAEQHPESLELSDFLKSLTGEMSDRLAEVTGELDAMPMRVAETIAKGIGAGLAEAFKPLVEKVESIEKSIGATQADLDEIGRRPVRPGAYTTIEKSVGSEDAISPAKAKNILMKSAQAGLCPAELMAQFEIDPASVAPDLIKSLSDQLAAK